MDYQYVNTDPNSTHYEQDYAKVDKDGKEYHIYRDGYGPEVPAGSTNVLAADWHPAPVTGAGAPVAAAPPAPVAVVSQAPQPITSSPPPAPATPVPPNPPGNVTIVHTGEETPIPPNPGNVNVVHTGQETPPPPSTLGATGGTEAPSTPSPAGNTSGTFVGSLPTPPTNVVAYSGSTQAGSTGTASADDSASINATPEGAVYTVVHGDTLSGIAGANGVELSKLEALNPQIKDPNMIFPGQAVNLGGAGPAPLSRFWNRR